MGSLARDPPGTGNSSHPHFGEWGRKVRSQSHGRWATSDSTDEQIAIRSIGYLGIRPRSGPRIWLVGVIVRRYSKEDMFSPTAIGPVARAAGLSAERGIPTPEHVPSGASKRLRFMPLLKRSSKSAEVRVLYPLGMLAIVREQRTGCGYDLPHSDHR